MKTRKKVKLFFFFFLIGAVSLRPLHSGPEWSFGGYLKSFLVVFDTPAADGLTVFSLPDRPLGMINNRLRLDMTFKPSDSLFLSLSYSVSPRIQDSVLFQKSPAPSSLNPFQYRFADFNSRLYPSMDEIPENFGVFQNLDRAFLTIKSRFADIMIGRQAIAWGSARAINPTDILAPFSFEELDTEDRIGVDALRVRVPLGFMGELDAGYVAGKDFNIKRSALFLRGKFYAFQTDFSLIAMRFHGNLLLGLDVTRSIGGAGAWLEAAYVFSDAFKKNSPGEKKDYFRFTTGVDYSPGASTYAFVEYHFSGAGSKDPEVYIRNISSPAFAQGAVYLLGRHYIVPGVNHQITPLLGLAVQGLWNLSDKSLLVSPHLEYNIAENIYISAGAFIGIGRSPGFKNRDSSFPAPFFRSEFGGYPDVFFASFRVYF